MAMENNCRAEIRFRLYHYFFYIGGVPLFYSAVSNLYRVYSLSCVFLHDDYCHVYEYLPPFRRLGSYVGYGDGLYFVCLRKLYDNVFQVTIY
jgi:hypothetical protein